MEGGREEGIQRTKNREYGIETESQNQGGSGAEKSGSSGTQNQTTDVEMGNSLQKVKINTHEFSEVK